MSDAPPPLAVPGDNRPNEARQLEANERAAWVVAQRVKGRSYQDIADEMGVNVRSARRYAKLAIDARILTEDSDALVKMERARLDDLYRRALVVADDPKAYHRDRVAALEAALRVRQTHQRFEGIERPAQGVAETAAAGLLDTVGAMIDQARARTVPPVL